MATNQALKNFDDFEFMGDAPREDPVIAERRRARENEITKKLGEYLLKGYCMLGDSCQDCNCILLRSPEQKIFCVGCDEIDVQKPTTAPVKKEETKKKSQTKKADRPATAATTPTGSHSTQLENKLKWAVEELSKTQNTNRINEMCSVILKLTETIKALKQLEKN